MSVLVRGELSVGHQPFCATDSVDPLADITEEQSDKEISRAIGDELRRAREALGWSQKQLVARLPRESVNGRFCPTSMALVTSASSGCSNFAGRSVWTLLHWCVEPFSGRVSTCRT